jgi:hypothetical protein
MCLAGGPDSLDLTADERFWRDEQSRIIEREKLQKECSCVPFVPRPYPHMMRRPAAIRDVIEQQISDVLRNFQFSRNGAVTGCGSGRATSAAHL